MVISMFDIIVFPEPEPQGIVSRLMLELNLIKNGLLNLLPGRQTNILYPEELDIGASRQDNWRTHGSSVQYTQLGRMGFGHRETDPDKRGNFYGEGEE